DSHNVICIGDNDEDMMLAVKTIKGIGGGIVLIKNHDVFDYLRLEVAGLMTSSDHRHVEGKLNRLNQAIHQMGVSDEDDPFLSLAFLSLPVIPELKCTDFGLFDVGSFKLIPLEAREGES
ncbi:MAG: adenine deaminase C-terminal domain-containing protein, partial [Candidatus Izemoplasmatales bacterium]|nr:adenine deaminase C-terminal domain-containing protein [Candidatus Izemoplasmatales bacterium]